MKAFKKATKRIAAVAASATLVSSAAFGAMDLGNYPMNFAKDGEFNGKVVYGSDAAASDSAAARTIIDDLRAEFSGESSKYTIKYSRSSSEGETVRIADSGTEMNYGEDLQDVRNSDFDSQDSDILEDGSIKLSSTEDYEQTVTVAANGLFEHALRDELDDDIGTHLFFKKGDIVTYDLEFDSSIDMSGLDDDDIIGKELTIMGNEFTIGDDYSKQGAGDEGLDKLKLIGGSNKISLGEGESASVTLDGKTYDVKLLTMDTSEAIIEVNGKSASVDVYESETISGVSIAVTSLVGTTRSNDDAKGYATIVVGGNEILLEHNSEVKINDEDISDMYEDYKVTATFNNVAGVGWDGITLTYEWDGSDGFLLEAGESWVDRVFQTFSIMYEGTNDVDYSEVKLESSGETLKLSGETIDGEDFDQEIAKILDKTNSTSPAFLIGDSDDVPMFVDDVTLTDFDIYATSDYTTQIPGAPTGGNDYVVMDTVGRVIFAGDDTEILELFEEDGSGNIQGINSTKADDGLMFLTGDEDNQKLYSITGYDDSDDEFDFENVLEDGETRTGVKFDDVDSKLEDVAFTANDVTDLITVIDNADPEDRIAFANQLMVDITALPNLDVSNGVITFEYDTADLDEDTAGDAATVQIDMGEYDTSDDEFTLDLNSVGLEDFAGYSGAEFDISDSNDDTVERVTAYGTKVIYDVEDKKEVTIMTPDEQVRADVYLAFGEASSSTMEVTVDEDMVESKKAELEDDGYTIVDTYKASSEDVEFDVSAPVMDSDVSGSDDMIVVGGPAVNAVARELMGISTYTIDQAGVSPNEGVIRYFESKNSILVYGYSAADTTAAVNKLNSGGLSGSSVNVN